MENEILIVGINSILGRAVYAQVKSEGLVFGVYHVNKDNIPAEIVALPVDQMRSWAGKVFKTIYLISSFIPESGDEDDQKLVEANVYLPKMLSELFPAARMVYCSSVSVYQNYTTGRLISIDDEPKPKTKYALSKLWGENIIKQHPSYAIVRISSMYGVGMKQNTFLPSIIRDLISNQRICLHGDGSRDQNYIHVDDVATILIKAGKLSHNTSLLAVDNQSYSNKEIAELVLYHIPGYLAFSGEDPAISYVYDNSFTHYTLGKIEFTPIKEGINNLITWMKKEL